MTKNTGKKTRDREDFYQRRVVVRFEDHIELPKDPAVLEKCIETDRLGPWKALVQQFPGVRFRPRWRSRKAEEIEKLIDQARRRDSTYRPGRLLAYAIAVCPNNCRVEELAKALADWPTIAQAWADPGPVVPPLVNAGDDPRWPDQGYLDPAPQGIDAEYAWTFTGGDGDGQDFVDLERGWTLNHEDLVAAGVTLISGVSQDFHGHGTAVLGEVAAVDNTIGCVGITPNLASVRVVSQWRSATDYDTADAIIDAAASMGFGQVLLLEAQTSIGAFVYVPVEVYDDTFDAIRLATALGIVVVEAAGNGGVDLDTLTNAAGDFILNRGSVDFRDSGAIVVGAASASAPHSRLGFSCFGSRIDCYGWGESIDTTGDGWTGTSTAAYTTSFGGTSGASPIVSGAALALQGIAEASLGLRFSPKQMRAILTDPATSTPSADPPTDRIGVMPNLRAVIDSGDLNLRADIYLRDFVGDNGDPHTGSISASPDVILVPTAVADPTAAFGPGSGTENDNALGFEAEAGQPNFIYVRTKNRGGSDAVGATCEVYWSPVSTLVTPDLWTLVDTVALPTVPAGDVLTVSSAITWPAAAIPAPGHYCLVGIAGHPGDPAPTPVDFLDWDNFKAFIRNNNNVTWRNFNVVDNEPPPPGMLSLPFLMPGAFDQRRRMRLELGLRLPRGAKAALELPAYLAERFFGEQTPFMKANPKDQTIRVPLNPHGVTRLRDISMPAKSRVEMALLVHIPKERRQNAYLAHAAQFEGEEELGRVTWQLTPKPWLKKRREWLEGLAKKT